MRLNTEVPTQPATKDRDISRRSLDIVAFLFVIFVQVTPAFSQNTPVKEFVVFHLPPYGYQSNQGHSKGIFIDLAELLGERAGIPVNSKVLPLKRMFFHLDEERADCSIFLKTDWSMVRYDMVAPLIEDFDTIIFSRNTDPIKRIEDLKGARVAAPLGSRFGNAFDQNPNIDIFRSMDYQHSAKLMKVGRVDAIIGTRLSLYYSLKKAELDPAELAPPLIYRTGSVWLQCRRDALREDERERFRKAALSLLGGPEIDALINRYLQ